MAKHWTKNEVDFLLERVQKEGFKQGVKITAEWSRRTETAVKKKYHKIMKEPAEEIIQLTLWQRILRFFKKK